MNSDDLDSNPFFLNAERIVQASMHMTDGEKAALQAWEKENLGSGTLGTTDWPGWTAILARISH